MMKLSIKTITLQNMVTRAMKGASNNKMIPITGLMCIELNKENTLTLTTTDATNYLYVKEEKVEGDYFYVVVQAEQFSKLISKMTCENIELTLEDSVLNIRGNGKYKIELPLDENGQLIKYPNPISTETFDESPVEINLTTVRNILQTNKAALATTLDIPCYTGYYFGDKVVTTDTYKICGNSIKCLDRPALLSTEMMDLLNVMADEHIKVYRAGDKLAFRTPDCIVYGSVLDGIDNYAIEPISSLLDEDYDSYCLVSKQAILATLDRLMLFVGSYDKNGIYMTFTRDGIAISSKKSNGSELIEYKESENFTDFTCCINIEMLQTQIKAQVGDVVEIHYGRDNAIKMIDGSVTQIVALEEDDR